MRSQIEYALKHAAVRSVNANPAWQGLAGCSRHIGWLDLQHRNDLTDLLRRSSSLANLCCRPGEGSSVAAAPLERDLRVRRVGGARDRIFSMCGSDRTGDRARGRGSRLAHRDGAVAQAAVHHGDQPHGADRRGARAEGAPLTSSHTGRGVQCPATRSRADGDCVP